MVHIIVLSILYTIIYVTVVLAFQTAPALSRYGFLGNSNQHHFFIHHHPSHYHPSTLQSQLDAKNDGYDDWYIDDEKYNKPIIDDMSANKSGSKSLSKANSSSNNDNDEQQIIRTYFATCIPGLHNTLYNELITLGAKNVETQGKSGVRFQGTSKVGLKSILWCRTAHKIMELIASSCDPPQLDDDYYDNSSLDNYDSNYGIQTKDDLYHFVKTSIHTPSLLGDGSGGLLTLSVSTIYASKPPNKELCHSHYTALTVKNALVDSVRELRDDGIRPNVDIYNPDVPLVVVLKGRRLNNGSGRSRGRNDYNSYETQEDDMVADVELYRCLHTQGSLHRRGYRSGSTDDSASSSWNDDDVETEWEMDTDNSRRRNNNRPQEVSTSAPPPIHKAAMKETMAAGLLLESGWDKLVSAARGDGQCAVLVDPMTGSGTLPVEAALIACDMAPGLLRIASWRSSDNNDRQNPHRFPPCIRWKDFSDQTTWDELLDKATSRAKSGMKWARSLSSSEQDGHKNVKILCNEINPRAKSLAQSSIRSAGVGSLVSLSEGDCIHWGLGGESEEEEEEEETNRDIIQGRTIFVCNPPWGLRLTDDIDESWVSLREFLRREAGGCESWVLSGNKDLTKILRMRTSRKVPVQTAGEDLRWLQYHIFQKSKNKIEV